MLCDERTLVDGTLTTEGVIPHFRHKGLSLPIVLDVDNTKGVRNIMDVQRPFRSNQGFLVYALPGGGVFVNNGGSK